MNGTWFDLCLTLELEILTDDLSHCPHVLSRVK